MLDDKWITLQLEEVRKLYPTITASVMEQIKEMLSSQHLAQQLSSAELKDISMKLIKDMDPNTSETDKEE